MIKIYFKLKMTNLLRNWRRGELKGKKVISKQKQRLSRDIVEQEARVETMEKLVNSRILPRNHQ
jgi:hypothetical protein